MSREHRTETTFEQVAEELAAVSRPLLVDMVQEGARRMLVTALQIEVEASIGEFAAARDAGGRVMVVRNGQERERAVATAAGGTRGKGATDTRPPGGRALREHDPAAVQLYRHPESVAVHYEAGDAVGPRWTHK